MVIPGLMSPPGVHWWKSSDWYFPGRICRILHDIMFNYHIHVSNSLALSLFWARNDDWAGYKEFKVIKSLDNGYWLRSSVSCNRHFLENDSPCKVIQIHAPSIGCIISWHTIPTKYSFPKISNRIFSEVSSSYYSCIAMSAPLRNRQNPHSFETLIPSFLRSLPCCQIMNQNIV